MRVKTLLRRLTAVAAVAALALTAMIMAAGSASAQNLPNGQFCNDNRQCASGHCADGRRCAPRDRTGVHNSYCHHDNHCVNQNCVCAEGGFGYCANWERWLPGTNADYPNIGRCVVSHIGTAIGAGYNCEGRRNQCGAGLQCADGKVCAPEDRRGRSGQYCHHDNHCNSGFCHCPGGNKSWGFCAGWEGYLGGDREDLTNSRLGFYCE